MLLRVQRATLPLTLTLILTLTLTLPLPLTLTLTLPSNHAHQAELLVPILDNALTRNAAPEVLRWGWPLTHWMAQVLPAAQP